MGRKPTKRRGRGEGGIEQMPDGRWRATLSLGIDPDTGRRRRRKFYGETKAEALAKLQAAAVAAGRGELPDARGLTVGRYLQDWLDGLAGRVEPATVAFYERRVRLRWLPRLEAVPLASLTPYTIEQAVAAMAKAGDSPGERRKALTTLRAALSAAVRLGLIPSNPAARVKRPACKKEAPRFLTPQEARRLIEAADGTPDGPLVRLALDAGLGPGELFALDWPDLDLSAGTVTIRRSLEDLGGKQRLKGPKVASRRRTVALAASTVAALAAVARPSGPVFPDTCGGRLRLSCWRQRRWLPLLTKAGLGALRPYDMRHTCASLLLAAGVPVRVVSERLGHADPATTLRHYAHALPTAQAGAASVWESLIDPQQPPKGGKTGASKPQEKPGNAEKS